VPPATPRTALRIEFGTRLERNLRGTESRNPTAPHSTSQWRTGNLNIGNHTACYKGEPIQARILAITVVTRPL